jgi:methylmalonyl-CoA mutase
MGSVQSALKGEQDKMMDKVANGSTVLLGTNIHPNKEEMMGDKINKSDFKPVLDNQITKTFPPISKIRWSERLETERLANEKMNA